MSEFISKTKFCKTCDIRKDKSAYRKGRKTCKLCEYRAAKINKDARERDAFNKLVSWKPPTLNKV